MLVPAYLLDDLRRVIKSVERGHQVDAARAFLQFADHFDRDADAFTRAPFS